MTARLRKRGARITISWTGPDELPFTTFRGRPVADVSGGGGFVVLSVIGHWLYDGGKLVHRGTPATCRAVAEWIVNGELRRARRGE